MAFIKFASAALLQAEIARPGQGLMRTAHRHTFDYTPREGFLYVRSRAISSRTNDNFDTFPADEIKKGWKSFIGKPVFVNHHNDDHRRARGVIIDAALHEDTAPDHTPDTWVEVLMEVDAINFPKLAAAILAGDIERTSMGCDVAYSLCSVCGNKASSPVEYCSHIPRLKGKKIRRRTASGNGTEDVLVHEVCCGLSFFENSLLVEPPADPTAFFLGVDDRGVQPMGMKMSKAASRKQAAKGEYTMSIGALLDEVTRRQKPSMLFRGRFGYSDSLSQLFRWAMSMGTVSSMSAPDIFGRRDVGTHTVYGGIRLVSVPDDWPMGKPIVVEREDGARMSMSLSKDKRPYGKITKAPAIGLEEWANTQAKDRLVMTPVQASRKTGSAGTMEIALTLLDAVPSYLHERIKRLLPYIVNGPGYNRGVDEELMTAIRMGDRDDGNAREWFLRKAEAKAHYDETGEWIKPVHPGDEGGSKDQMSLFSSRLGYSQEQLTDEDQINSGWGMMFDDTDDEPSDSFVKASSADIRYQVRFGDKELGRGVGIVEAVLGDEVIGALRWDFFTDPPMVIDMSVEPQYQRMGIATQMWNVALQNESRLVHSDSLTDEGRAWMNSLGSATGKKYKDNYKGNTTERGYGWDHQKKREELLKGNPKCHHCGERKATQADHYNGGLVPSCADCNNKRSHEQKKRKNKKKGAVMQGSGGVAMLPIGEVQPGMIVRRWSSHDWGLVVETKVSQIQDRSKDDRRVFVTVTLTDPANPSGPQWKLEAEWREEVQVSDALTGTASRRLASGDWVESFDQMNTYGDLSEAVLTYFKEAFGGNAIVARAPLTNKWMWSAEGRDGEEASGLEADLDAAQTKAVDFLSQHGEIKGQMSLFGSRHLASSNYPHDIFEWMPGEWKYVLYDENGAVKVLQRSVCESAEVCQRLMTMKHGNPGYFSPEPFDPDFTKQISDAAGNGSVVLSTRRLASLNRENIVWQSPDGKWSRAFWAWHPTGWGEDWDEEWDVEYTDEFNWVTRGWSTEEQALRAWRGDNPGSYAVEEDPQQIVKLDQMAKDFVAKNGDSGRSGGRSRYSTRRLAYGEVKAPAAIDTLRIKDCPVCGEDESWDSDGRCKVCGYLPPPEPFRQPDLEVAKKVDMRGESVNPELFKSPAFEEPEDEDEVESDEGVEDETEDEEEKPVMKKSASRYATIDLTRGPDRPSRNAGIRWEGMMSSRSSGYEVDVLWPGDEVMMVSAYINDLDRATEWAKMAYEAGAVDVFVTEIHFDRRSAGRRPVVSTSTPTKYQRHPRILGDEPMRPTAATAARQQQIIQIQADRINRLERQVARLRRFADANNPAQPVAEPGSEAPAATTDQTRAADATTTVTQPGGVTQVQQAPQTQVTQPGGVGAAPQAIQQSVTSPVNGYQQPVADMRTEVDVNHDAETIGENAYAGDWANAGGQATAQARTFAALRLARLRIEAGIASGDDITLAQKIAGSRVSNAQIRTEIETLSKVQRTASTRRTASAIRPQAVRNVPSLVSTAAPVVAVAAPSMNPSADEFLFD